MYLSTYHFEEDQTELTTAYDQLVGTTVTT